MHLVSVPYDRDPGSFPGHFLWNLSGQCTRDKFLPEYCGLPVNYHFTPPVPPSINKRTVELY